MYEGGIRVPMIVRWPGRIKPGAVSDLPWYFPDVLPTFADLAGASKHVPEDIDGISIAPTLLGKPGQTKHDYLYWEWPSYNWRKRKYDPKGLKQAVRAGDWKLVRHKRDESWQLYDLASDVGERKNIAAQHTNVVARMAAWVKKNRIEPPPQIEPEMPKGRKYR
jgi:arylsulfatase A-like enzyme